MPEIKTETPDPAAIWKEELTAESAAHQATKKELATLTTELTRLTSSREAFLDGFRTPVRIISIIDTDPESTHEIVVGWDTCGKCIHHISICECPHGPTEPSYITKFRSESRIAENFGLSVTTSAVAVEETPSSITTTTPSDVHSTSTTQKCSECHKLVNLDPKDGDADLMDNGKPLCFTCQEKS